MGYSRRNALIGFGGLIAGGGALISTGAFTTVQAERTVNVETTGDADAFLAIEPGAEGGEYVSENGTIEIDISNTSAGGQGVNQNAITAIDQLLEVTNNGTNDVEAGFDKTIDEGEYAEDEPGGWAYAISQNASSSDEDALVVLWACPSVDRLNRPLREVRPGLTDTAFGGASGLVSDPTIVNEIDDRTIEPGQSLNVGIIIDTRNRSIEQEPIPSELNNTISFYATATSN
jgi:hypothetical protein